MKTRHAAPFLALSLLLVAGASAAACAADGTVDRAQLLDEAGTTPETDAGPDAVAAPDAGGDGAAPLPACSADGWCYSTLPAASSFDAGTSLPDPEGFLFPLRSVWVAPDHHAWAVSATGHVLHWNGTAWKVEFIARAGLRSVWGTSATDLWLAGDSGLLLHGTGSAGALVFQPVALGSAQGISRVWGTSSTDVWLLADRVYHLTADTASTATPFVPVTVPTPYGSAAATVRVTAVWGSATETWFGGNESTFCAPPDCTNADHRFVVRRTVAAGGAVSWSSLPLDLGITADVAAGLTTAEGVQVLTVRGGPYTDTALVARVATDASKLDPKRGPITVTGEHAWSFEIAASYGLPEGLWGRTSNDLWLVGRSGVVRHFDGLGWQISRVARTKLSPLVNDLYGVDAIVDASGERDMWVVGDDVALHREVKP